MVVKVAVLVVYFLSVVIIGFVARTRWRSSPETYFLADRKLSTGVLLATMVATNFSAFTVFGTSGAGYRDGYAFFPIMGFGTGFMALTFWILGRKIWRLGKEHGSVTPTEVIGAIYGNRFLSFLFSVVMIVFTVPYLALQPMAAGYSLEALVGLPYFMGCILVTGIIVLYTLWGGLRAIAWTDVFQGALMAVLLAVSLILVAHHQGGFTAANQKVLAIHPELFSRPGGLGQYTLGIWFSYMMLWFFCDPMFPQLFQRFFSARSERTISIMMVFYPLVCSLIFFMPVAVGVLGHLTFPGLVGKEADRILPLVMTLAAGDLMAALVISCGLAALMSTMDSQLLTLSSIFTRDIVPLFTGRTPTGHLAGRIFVIVLSVAGLALAYRPPSTILQIATQTFTGLAVLFPTVLFGLYMRNPKAASAILSILCGEAMVVLFFFGFLPAGPVLPVVWVMLVAFASYLLPQCALTRQKRLFPLHRFNSVSNPHVYVFTAIFLLSLDFWAWNKTGPQVAGVPVWIAHFLALSGLQTAFMIRLLRREPD